jgi:hypothetical protein
VEKLSGAFTKAHLLAWRGPLTSPNFTNTNGRDVFCRRRLIEVLDRINEVTQRLEG